MLSDTAVRNAKAKDKPYKLSDEKGLYLLIQPSGSKLWRLDYRFDDKRKTIALGSYPDVPIKGDWLDQSKRVWIDGARDKRDHARKLLADGKDPSEHRKNEKAAERLNSVNSFELIAREWWNSHMAGKAESHKEKVIRRFELYLFPWIGGKPISTLTAPKILEVVQRIASSNKLETAHRTLQATGQVFRYAVQKGLAVRDVTTDLKGALPATTVKHMAAFTEPKDVAELLRAVDGFNGTFTVLSALRLSPLVFARPGELRKAKWRDIDLDLGVWQYFVTKTKTDHIVPLSTQAIAILRELHPLSGHGEYVFQGGHSPLKPMSESAVNAALKRMGYDTQTEHTGHGFRAMARTILHERLGIDPAALEHQLAHKVPDSLGGAYNRTKFIEQRKVMMQTWADYLDELKAGAKVLPFMQV